MTASTKDASVEWPPVTALCRSRASSNATATAGGTAKRIVHLTSLSSSSLVSVSSPPSIDPGVEAGRSASLAPPGGPTEAGLVEAVLSASRSTHSEEGDGGSLLDGDPSGDAEPRLRALRISSRSTRAVDRLASWIHSRHVSGEAILPIMRAMTRPIGRPPSAPLRASVSPGNRSAASASTARSRTQRPDRANHSRAWS